MVFNLKQTQSNIPQSSTSSCTEFISEIRCGSNRCPKCCISSAINDHTYEVLKKICKKIIKDINRKQCRENYSVFDGGNSVKVRIQRGESMDAERSAAINKYKPGMTDSSYVGARGRQMDELGEKGRSRQISSGRQGRSWDNDEYDALGRKRDNTRSKSTKRGGEDGDDDTYGDKIKSGKLGTTKGKKKINEDEDDYDPRSKKTKDRKSSKQGDDFENENKVSKGKAKGKTKPEAEGKRKSKGDDYDETERSKKGKGKGTKLDDDSEVDLRKNKSKKAKGDNDFDEPERNKKGKGKAKGRNLDDDDSEGDLSKKKSKPNAKGKSKGKRPSGDGDDDDDDDDVIQKKKLKGKKKTKGGGRNENDDDLPTGKGKLKPKSKSDMPIITDLRSKVRQGQEVRPDGKQGRMGVKDPRKDKDRLKSLDKELSKLKKKQKSAKQLLAEQQENAGGKGKFGKGNSRAKSQGSSSRQYGSRFAHGFASEARISSKLSRGDQARPCDFLRANMEQRELCRLSDQISVNSRAPCYDPCNNRARNVCSEVIQSCCYPSNTCF